MGDPHGAPGRAVAVGAETALSVAMYSLCSVSMILLNKLVIDSFGLNFPMGLLFLQNAAAVTLVVGAKTSGAIYYPAFNSRIAWKWLPLTALFITMLWTSMKSLQLMSVAVQTIIKNLAIILTALGDHYFFGKRLTTAMFVAFALMVVGSALGSAGDRWVTAWGLFWTLANVFVTCSYVLYMKLLLGDVSQEIGRYGPVFYNNMLSLPFILILGFRDLPEMFAAIRGAQAAALVSLAAMIFVGSCMTFASFWCMKMTSPTTYSVVGALNKVPVAFLGILIFGHFPSVVGYTGIFVGLGGGMLYTWLNRPTHRHLEAMEEGRKPV